MLKSIKFRNFKCLRDTVLPLGRCNVIVGPNGSGKTTALEALRAVHSPPKSAIGKLRSVGASNDDPVELTVTWQIDDRDVVIHAFWSVKTTPSLVFYVGDNEAPKPISAKVKAALEGVRVFSLNAGRIAQSSSMKGSLEVPENGAELVSVLDRLRDQYPERFGFLQEEIQRLFPEYDCILFDSVGAGSKRFELRLASGLGKIAAENLSQGTRIAIAIITLAHLPTPPPVVAFEELDRGIHPRLLRDIQDALYRLAYPENFGEQREPVQVIITTHSPYLLDLFRDHPEEIIIASKMDGWATFEPLASRGDIHEILGDAPLGEVWYSGILGGVPE